MTSHSIARTPVQASPNYSIFPMKSTNKPLDWLIIAVLIAPFLYAALVWDQLPASIATHFDLEGRVNGT
ncbi:MAG: DUF1648 domain-containing protein, partial [Rudanella sp.]|nr:DUF1648 domain-containing protein [Rudanella sp.]